MNTGKARAIFEDIYSDNIDVEDKLLAIQEVVDMPTHNSIKKADAIKALKWLIEEYI